MYIRMAVMEPFSAAKLRFFAYIEQEKPWNKENIPENVGFVRIIVQFEHFFTFFFTLFLALWIGWKSFANGGWQAKKGAEMLCYVNCARTQKV